jgi:hypothetical protein
MARRHVGKVRGVVVPDGDDGVEIVLGQPIQPFATPVTPLRKGTRREIDTKPLSGSVKATGGKVVKSLVAPAVCG